MHPEPLFQIFGRGVYLYGICMALGIILCFVFLLIAFRKRGFNEASSDMILFIGVFGTAFGVLSAMLFQSLYNYIADPAAGFNFGSMTFIGGLIGGVVSFVGVYLIYIYVVRPRTNIKWLAPELNATLTDALPIIPIGITIAHAFGRLGCFFAGCCYGKPTDSWIGLSCADGYHGNVVPVQLLEMSFLVILGLVMAVLYFKFNFKFNFSLYAIAYGVWRFGIEYVRADERGQFLGTALSPSQFWSIIMVLAGVGYVFLQLYVLEKHMKHPEFALLEEERNRAIPTAEITQAAFSAVMSAFATLTPKAEVKAEAKPTESESEPKLSKRKQKRNAAKKPSEE